MVVSCWVNGCSNRADGSTKRGFFCIPKVREFEGEQTMKLSEERRRVWLANINRKEAPAQSSKICSDHCVMGKPTALYDRASPDWAPTLKLAVGTPRKSTRKLEQVDTNCKRYKRAYERHETKQKHHAARTLLDLHNDIPEPELYTATHVSGPPGEADKTQCKFSIHGTMQPLDKDTKLSVTPVTQGQVDSEIQRLITENIALKTRVNEMKITQDSLVNQDEKVKYYTGLPTYLTLPCLLTLLTFVGPYIPSSKTSEIGVFERLLMTLMRLKLNLPIQDLAYRFHTSTSTVSRTFIAVIHVLYVRLKHLIYWPDREELQKTTPLEFRKHFGTKTSVIIDCFEVFIQRPKNLLARAQTWSSYKHNNTVKFLIGITPQGTVSFLSKAWGGRASDKYITEHCGLLTKLLPGDLVLADRGFDIADSVGMQCAQVNIPSFTKGRSQLSPVDIETTRQIAHVRIQVERVIGLVRNKYTILQDKLPIDFLMSDDGATPVVDKIATVSCALSNMCESVVAFN